MSISYLILTYPAVLPCLALAYSTIVLTNAFLVGFVIYRIDLLVSHSSSVYPTALLWRDTDRVSIKSIAFINPTGHRRIKAMRPKIWTSIFVRLYQKPCTRCLIRFFGGPVLAVTGCPVESGNMDDVILSATTMVYSKFRHVRQL